jgi:hypothetical protein
MNIGYCRYTVELVGQSIAKKIGTRSRTTSSQRVGTKSRTTSSQRVGTRSKIISRKRIGKGNNRRSDPRSHRYYRDPVSITGDGSPIGGDEGGDKEVIGELYIL